MRHVTVNATIVFLWMLMSIWMPMSMCWFSMFSLSTPRIYEPFTRRRNCPMKKVLTKITHKRKTNTRKLGSPAANVRIGQPVSQ